MPSAKDNQVVVSTLSEWVIDRLRILAFANGRTLGGEAASLIDAQISYSEKNAAKKMKYLAEKRGISVKELERQILSGEAKRLPPEATGGNDMP